jgi:hypothetical protein
VEDAGKFCVGLVRNVTTPIYSLASPLHASMLKPSLSSWSGSDIDTGRETLSSVARKFHFFTGSHMSEKPTPPTGDSSSLVKQAKLPITLSRTSVRKNFVFLPILTSVKELIAKDIEDAELEDNEEHNDDHYFEKVTRGN